MNRHSSLQQEQSQIAQAIEVGPIDDRSALAFALDQTGTAQCRKMRRHRVLRDIEEPGELACRNSVRFVPHEQTERLRAGVLGQGRKGYYRTIVFHISRTIDILSALRLRESAVLSS